MGKKKITAIFLIYWINNEIVNAVANVLLRVAIRVLAAIVFAQTTLHVRARDSALRNDWDRKNKMNCVLFTLNYI